MCRIRNTFCINCLKSWRKWLSPLVMTIYLGVILVILPFLTFELQKHEATPSVQAWFIGGLFVILALPISFWEILNHLIHYTQPHLQKYIIRILWMVPVYAVDAWLALSYPRLAIYFDTARACYEAYVIYNFMMFLLTFLHFELNLTGILEEKESIKPLFPFCLMKPMKVDWSFIEGCKNGILQFTLIKPLTTLISFACEMGGVYGEGSFIPNVAFPYLMVIDNISQFVAMYSLVMFYKAFDKELKPMKPLPKFLCIKSVVFFSFFQSFIISILVSVGVINSTFTTESKTNADIGQSIQDFLICFEMFIAAVVHKFAFSYHPYVNLAAEQIPCCQSFIAMLDLSDVQQDVSDHLSFVGNKVKNSFQRNGGSKSTPEVRTHENKSLIKQPSINSETDQTAYQSTSTRSDDQIIAGKDEIQVKNSPTSKGAKIEDAKDVVDDLVDLSSEAKRASNVH